jgi:2,7-dihydroxy-5-methyl-1-naphthoate 7-O-methyltransferase
VGALGRLGVGVRDGVDPFATANGLPFFEWMASHPGRSAAFDEAMEAGARMHGLVVAAALDWSGSRAVCDVGGGTGAFLAVLLEQEPHLRGAVLDLPAVIARARPHDRIEFVAGDAFAAIPTGFDTYAFVNVLHDWGDEDALRLLTRAREATDKGARIVVVDADRPRRPVDDVSLQTDLLMLALTPGGRERSADDFAAIGSRAGLRLDTRCRWLRATVPTCSCPWASAACRRRARTSSRT